MVASCLKLTAASRQVASPPLGSTAEGVRVEIYRACEGPIEARAQESMGVHEVAKGAKSHVRYLGWAGAGCLISELYVHKNIYDLNDGMLTALIK